MVRPTANVSDQSLLDYNSDRSVGRVARQRQRGLDGAMMGHIAVAGGDLVLLVGATVRIIVGDKRARRRRKTTLLCC